MKTDGQEAIFAACVGVERTFSVYIMRGSLGVDIKEWGIGAGR